MGYGIVGGGNELIVLKVSLARGLGKIVSAYPATPPSYKGTFPATVKARGRIEGRSDEKAEGATGKSARLEVA
jgi:hypothetical protein